MTRKLDLAVMAVGWVGFIALFVYSGINSAWSSSYSAEVLTGYLVTFWFLVETINRLARRVARRRRLRH
jgi:hypothetical protein